MFFCRANSNLDSLACSLDSEISEIQPGPSELCFFFFLFYPKYQQFFENENSACSESPVSVSRENN